MKKGPNKKRSILLDSCACYTRILILSAEQSGISMDFKTIDLTLITLEIHSKSRLFGSGASIVKHSIPAFIDIDLFDLYFLIKAMTSTLVWKALALASSAKDESPSGSELTCTLSIPSSMAKCSRYNTSVINGRKGAYILTTALMT